MYQHKKNLFCLCSALIGMLAISPVMADGMPENQDKTMLQTDDSASETVESILNAGENTVKVEAKDDKTALNDGDMEDEKVATITAEGDFMVPTFLLPEANPATQKTPKIREKSVETRTQTVRELPVVKITQTELIPVREQMAVERRLTGKTTKTMQKYQEALARSKGVTGAGTQSQNTQTDSVGVDTDADSSVNRILTGEISAVSEEQPVKKKKLLLPLKPLPERKTVQEEISDTKPLYTTYTSEMADKALSNAQSDEEEPLLMPQEIKVTFYPNSAEFSGQTVKWIKVFSMRARKDPRYMVEIRLSRSNPTIQQKRLFVIQRILMNNGLSLHQIAVDYVDRPENSLILRMVRKNENVQTRKVKLKNGQVKERKTINW